MNYSEAETKRYDNMWRSLKGEFHRVKTNYKSDYPSSKLLDNFLDYYFLKSGLVLDLGCGTARNTIYLETQGFRSIGIDSSVEAIKLAEKNKKENNSKIMLLNKSVFDLKLEQKADFAIDFGLLHHLRVSEWRSYILSLNKNLKEDGKLYIYGFYNPSRSSKRYGKHFDKFLTKELIHKHFEKHFRIDKVFVTKEHKEMEFIHFYLSK